MRMTGTGRRAALRRGCATTVALLLAATTVAWPGEPAGATAPSQPVFGIHPALLHKTTLPNNHFGYALAAGTAISDTLVIDNYTAAPITISIYPADLLQASGGGLAPTQPGTPLKAGGAWLHLSRANVTVAAHGEARDPFNVRIPVGTAPGHYYGAVVAARSAGVTSNGLAVQTRAALIADLSVPGKAHVALDVSRPTTHRHGGTENATVNITNKGNVAVDLSNAVLLVHGTGDDVDQPLAVPPGLYVLPGGQATLSGSFGHLPRKGTVRASASVTAVVNGRPSGRFTGPTLRLRFFPWLLASAVLAAVVVATAGAVFGRRPLRRWWGHHREERRVVKELRRQRRLDPT